MKEDKKDISLKGNVVKKPFGTGSKSEHEAICIETKSGDSYKLKRMGGNPFSDPVLQKLVGKTIEANGIIDDYVFIAKTIKEV